MCSLIALLADPECRRRVLLWPQVLTGKTTEALHRHGRHSIDRFSQNATRTKPSTRAWEVASHSSIKIVAS